MKYTVKQITKPDRGSGECLDGYIQLDIVILENENGAEITIEVPDNELYVKSIHEGDQIEIDADSFIKKVPSDHSITSNTSAMKDIIRPIDFSGITSSLMRMHDIINHLNTPLLKESLFMISKTVASFSTIIVSDYMKSMRESFLAIGKVFEEARNNPDSYFNYHDYQEKLDNFHWAWPYGITSQELKILLEKVENEKQFDRVMVSFFSKKRVNEMFDDMNDLLPRKHKVMFCQIVSAFESGNYALANNGLISIIDNLLIDLLKNKGCVNRKGILHPIIDFYADHYNFSDVDFLFEVQMLSNNIDLIFGDYNFGDKIKIDSNKKVRRHLSAHGYMYSNNRADVIMLMNTLIALLVNIVYFKPFRGTLIRDKKTKLFIIVTSPYVVINRIGKELDVKKGEIQW